jgi:hypothetical protein
VSLIRDEVAAQSSDAGRSVIWPGLRVTTQLWFVSSVARAADPLLVAILDVLGAVWADGSGNTEPPRAAAPETVAADRPVVR